jgi:Ca2+-binding RTX toxin-like protein
VLFGDLGNDWIVGGTGRDHLYGGRGDDLLNVDDDHDSTADTVDPRANDTPDTHPSYEDIAFGGAGRDVLLGNTGGDRMIDWAGEFNSYIVPFAPFGNFTISRSLQPQLMEYLYDLSESDGADPTRASETGNDPERNGEPDGEIGLVKQSDFDWHDQTGAPNDPQPGNIPGGPRDVLRGATFNDGNADGFTPDSGMWAVEDSRFQVSPTELGGDAVSVFYVDNLLPSYFEMQATVNVVKPIAGWKANAYLIFDYQGKDDFKFAGLNQSINKLQMGHRDASGWIVDVQIPLQVEHSRDYNMLLSLHGNNATLLVDNSHVLQHTFAPRIVDGVAMGLSSGMVGIGADNSSGAIDNVTVQVLPRKVTLEETETFDDPASGNLLTTGISGQWDYLGGQLIGQALPGSGFAVNLVELGLENGLSPESKLEILTEFTTATMGGVVFDYYGPSQFKFVAILPEYSTTQALLDLNQKVESSNM